MAQAMYGDWAQQLVVQPSVFQAIVWITLLLFALEVRKAAHRTEICGRGDRVHDFTARSRSQEEGRSHQIDDIEATAYAANDVVSTTSVHTQSPPPPLPQVNGVQAAIGLITVVPEGDARKTAEERSRLDRSSS